MATTYFFIPSSVMKNNNGNAVRTFEPLTVLGEAILYLSWYTVESKNITMNEIDSCLLTV